MILTQVKHYASKAAGISIFTIAIAQKTLASAPTDLQQGVKDVPPAGAGTNLPTLITNVVNTLLYIIGIAAVIMLIVGGMQYVMSQGNESSVKNAKNTILYAIIGVVIAVIAYAVVNFVIGRFK